MADSDKANLTKGQLKTLIHGIKNAGGGDDTTVLTEADFNYDYNGSGTNNSIAVWLLQDGHYKFTQKEAMPVIACLARVKNLANPQAVKMRVKDGGTDGYGNGTVIEFWKGPGRIYVNEVIVWGTVSGGGITGIDSTSLVGPSAIFCYGVSTNTGLNPNDSTPLDYDMVLSDRVFPRYFVPNMKALLDEFATKTTVSTTSAGLAPRIPAGNTKKQLLNTGWEDLARADYEESDSTKTSYIENRPFYTAEVEIKTDMTDSTAIEQYVSISDESVGEWFYSHGLAEWTFEVFFESSAAFYSAIQNGETISIWDFKATEETWEGDTRHYLMKIDNVELTPISSSSDWWGATATLHYSLDEGLTWGDMPVGLAQLNPEQITEWSGSHPFVVRFAYSLGYGEMLSFNGIKYGTVSQDTVLKKLDAKYLPDSLTQAIADLQSRVAALEGGGQ